MGALYLKDLADKTRRGLRGRVEAGKSGGGNSYGYDVVAKVQRSRRAGARRAPRSTKPKPRIVRHIFNEYAAGKSPKAIAHGAQQAEGARPVRAKAGGRPRSTATGGAAPASSITSSISGRLVWNRLAYIKNPDTGKRVSRLNPESEWIVKDVPELRIVDQDLWERVKARQQGAAQAARIP